MNSKELSLRSMIRKWLPPSPATAVRLTRCGGPHSKQRRCVRVDFFETKAPLTLFFFQHADGSWRVFPPEFERPVMGVYRQAA